MSHSPKIALIVGGGVGADTIAPILELLAAAGIDLDFDRVDVEPATSSTSEDYLDAAANKIIEHKLALKTRLHGSTREAAWHAGGNRAPNPNVELRRRLDLYAGLRPIRSQVGLPTRYPDLDLLLVRENTEDIYKGIEHEVVPGVVESLKVVTRFACERITRYAYQLAAERKRKKVTFIHKANIMKRSDGLFLDTFRRISKEFPEFEAEDKIVDAACMQMVLDPSRFDVLLTGNLYGDILSSLGSGLAGGISNSHAINSSDELRVFEAINGDAPALVGSGKANPLPVVSAALALLRHLGEGPTAKRIGDAIGTVLVDGRSTTPDLGGNATTSEMCRAIAQSMSEV